MSGSSGKLCLTKSPSRCQSAGWQLGGRRFLSRL